MKFAALLAVVAAVLGAKSYETERQNIYCFTCSYTDQKRCIVANNLPSENCPPFDQSDRDQGVKLVCTKTIHPKALNNKRYDRGCKRVEAGEDFCEDFKRGKEPDTRCYTCDYQLCNASNQHLGKTILIFAVAIVALFL